jgi:hypothetical protein
MVISWDYLALELVLLAGIIYFSVHLEHWAYRRSQTKVDEKTIKNIIRFIKDNLERRLAFIDESFQYKDYKPFFTYMWNAVILSGKQSLLTFDHFQSIQRFYSLMKYYDSEIESNKRGNIDERVLREY